jgi:hypothetical protein
VRKVLTLTPFKSRYLIVLETKEPQLVTFLEEQIAALGYYCQTPWSKNVSQELGERSDVNNPLSRILCRSRDTGDYYCLWSGDNLGELEDKRRTISPFVACPLSNMPKNVVFENIIFLPEMVIYRGNKRGGGGNIRKDFSSSSSSSSSFPTYRKKVQQLKLSGVCSGNLVVLKRFYTASKNTSSTQD